MDRVIKEWFVIVTKSKCEKTVKRDLERKGLEVYLPLVTRKKDYKSGTRYEKNHLLITTYVFVKITLQERVSVLETMHVSDFIREDSKPVVIPEHEIETLKKAVKAMNLDPSGYGFTVEPYHFIPGDNVKVVGGTLEGMTGKLIKSEQKDRFMVQLKKIGVHLNISIHAKFLQRISGSSDS